MAAGTPADVVQRLLESGRAYGLGGARQADQRFAPVQQRPASGFNLRLQLAEQVVAVAVLAQRAENAGQRRLPCIALITPAACEGL